VNAHLPPCIPPSAAGDAARFWPPSGFSTEGGGKLSSEVIDVTGRQRHLFFGPYELLASGVWMARLELDLCPDAAKRALTAEFGVDPEMAAFDVAPGAPGPRTIELVQAIRTPGRAQVRLRLRRAAFHGWVRFTGVTLMRLGPCEDEA
jgi:hypothetical protein